MPRRIAPRLALLALAACARREPSAKPLAAHALAAADAGAGEARAAGPRLSDESAIAILGAQMLVARGEIRDPDAPRIEPAMRDAYAELRRAEDAGDPVARPRPWPGTSDVLLLGDETRAPAGERTAVVLLHGFGGRFALPCWQIARAVAALGVVTACPSIGPNGDWWTDDGARVVRETVATLRAAGYARLVLAGLSNGGVGASRLAARFADTFAAIVLISGADPAAAIPSVPVLVVQGTRDAMAPAEGARAYAKKARGRYVSLDAGHFALLVRSGEAEGAIREFVGGVIANGAK